MTTEVHEPVKYDPTKTPQENVDRTLRAPLARFIKIGEDGALLAPDESEWEAVLDTRTNLMWSREVLPRMSFKKALDAPEKLTAAGFKDWRLPTVEELFCLADRTKYGPAIDTAFFPDTPSAWFWSSTVDASSSGCAWVVYFGYGSSGWYRQGSGAHVRAVRSGQS
jgi:hypothetical protein